MTSSFGKARLVFSLFFLMLAVSFMAAQKPMGGGDTKLAPNGKHEGVPAVAGVNDAAAGPIGFTVNTGNGINYNGGPVMKANPVPIYIIWYGNWNGQDPTPRRPAPPLSTTLERWVTPRLC